MANIANLTDPVDTLARTIWSEARGDGTAGMTAVANVVMNRVKDGGWWGSTVCSVCLCPEQFSCWDGDDPNRAKLLAVTDADPQFVEAQGIATQAVAGKLADTTGGADSYYAVSIPAPYWIASAKFTVQIGHQLFYKTEGI